MRRWLRLSALGAVALAACAEPPSAPRQASQAQLTSPAQEPAFTPAHPVFATLFA